MLQKPEKGGYNRLSRRQVLKVLGVFSLVGGLPGCSSLLSPTIKSNNIHKVVPLSKEQLLANAFARVNKKLLKEAVKTIREIKRDYERDGNHYSAISRTRRVVEQVFDHYNSIGLTAALDSYTISSLLEAYNDLDPYLIRALRDEGFTREEIQESRDLVLQAKEHLLPIASTLRMSQIMADIIAKMKRKEEQLRHLSTIYGFETLGRNWLNCLRAALNLLAMSGAVVLSCSACAAPTPTTPVECYACAIAVVAYLSAYLDYLDACVL